MSETEALLRRHPTDAEIREGLARAGRLRSKAFHDAGTAVAEAFRNLFTARPYLTLTGRAPNCVAC
ncbi:hypothetical protein [Pacificispira sp.]|uniref:hypothetical protein n=1 Tax=Pacificispira sp. TaxID=2888761 RepID=UPI003BA99970